MKIEKTVIDTTIILRVEGRLDTITAPEFEREVKAAVMETSHLHLDLSQLDYVSSAGLRIFLMAQKTMSRRGSMEVSHVNELIMEIFETTGFCDILNII